MAHCLTSTPTEDGFYMPGEFAPHAGCYILWPERSDNWRLGAKPAQTAFVKVAEVIARFEPVTVGVSAAQWDNARARLPDTVRLIEISYNDSWVRDCGATGLVGPNGKTRAVSWHFNAWGGLNGGLYFPWDDDEKVAEKLCDLDGLDYYQAPQVLEGGSIHVDGEGTALVTEECLLNTNRNPGLHKEDIEKNLRAYLGVEKILWLPYGVYMDETNGHIDNMACFARPGEIILTWTDDKTDPQYERSAAALEILSHATDAKGRKLKVHKLIQPGPLYATQAECEGVDPVSGTQPRRNGDRLAGSYINHYLANGAVIAPVFGVQEDETALNDLCAIYPDREVLAIPAREILLGGGNIHCITQQRPMPRTS